MAVPFETFNALISYCITSTNLPNPDNTIDLTINSWIWYTPTLVFPPLGHTIIAYAICTYTDALEWFDGFQALYRGSTFICIYVSVILYLLFYTTPSMWIRTIETYNAPNLCSLTGWNLSNHITNSTILFVQHWYENVKQCVTTQMGEPPNQVGTEPQ